jgi:hypothetical protein
VYCSCWFSSSNFSAEDLILVHLLLISVPDLGSRDRNVVLVRHGACWGNPRGPGIWNGEGLRKGRSVYEQLGTKVDRIASRQRRVSK